MRKSECAKAPAKKRMRNVHAQMYMSKCTRANVGAQCFMRKCRQPLNSNHAEIFAHAANEFDDLLKLNSHENRFPKAPANVFGPIQKPNRGETMLALDPMNEKAIDRGVFRNHCNWHFQKS